MAKKEKQVKRYRNPNQRLNRWGYLFIAPFVITFLVFSLYPMISSIVTSFTNDNYVNKFKNDFDIFSNYRFVVHSKEFWHSYLNTFIIFTMNFIPQLVSALFFAVLFASKRIRAWGKGAFQFIYFLPNIITATSVAAIFSYLFRHLGDNQGGPMFELLVMLGMSREARPLFDPWSVRVIIAFIQFWMWFGNSMIVYIAGIKGIPDDVFEAAELDGASAFRVFFEITLPILKPIMLYSLITSIIGGLQMFDIPFMIGGQKIQSGFFKGTGSTTTITIYIYTFMKLQSDYGIASAASTILFLVSLTLSFAMYMIVFKEKDYSKKIQKRIAKYAEEDAN